MMPGVLIASKRLRALPTLSIHICLAITAQQVEAKHGLLAEEGHPDATNYVASQ